MLRYISFWILVLFTSFSISGQTFNVDIHVSAKTGESLAGVPISFENNFTGMQYKEKLSASGDISLTDIYAGTYTLIIEKRGLEKYHNTAIEIGKDTLINIVLEEPIRTPYELVTSEIYNPKTGKSDVRLMWNRQTDYFFDDFESYEDFSISFAPWTGLDLDNAESAPIEGSYPNRGLKQYAIIFNHLTMSPPLWTNPVYNPYSGKQYVSFIRTMSGVQNNDWLISPQIRIKTNNIVSFMAKSADRPKEQFKVLISTTGTAVEDFMPLTKGNYQEVGHEEWVNIEYNLTAYEGKDVYIAIQYISRERFMLMVDDFYVGPKNLQKQVALRSGRSAANPNESFETYLNDQLMGKTEDTEFTYRELTPGDYMLGVKAVYLTGSSDVATKSISLADATHFAKLTAKVTANAGDAENAYIQFVHRVTGDIFEDVVTNGESVLPFARKGDYLINVKKATYELQSVTFTHNSDDVVNIELKEIITQPFNLTADTTKSASGNTTDVLLKWNYDSGWSEDFEQFSDFTQNLSPFTTHDVDGYTTQGFMNSNSTLIQFPGVNTAMSCLVFNPSQTVPAMNEIAFPSGNKAVAFISSSTGKANDWLITPRLKIRDGYVFRFMAKAYTDMYGPEVFNVAISTTDTEPVSFKMIDENIQPSADGWAVYEIDLSDYVGQDVYLAINYVSNYIFFMMVDNFYVGLPMDDMKLAQAKAGEATYEIWLNDEKVGTTDQTSYKLTNLVDGNYKAGVKAIYTSGSSAMTEVSFVCDYDGVGLHSADATAQISLYPNPTSNGQFTVTAGEPISRVRLFNTNGIVVAQFECSATDVTVPTSELLAGLYMVEITTANGTTHHRVVVNK